MKFPLYRDNQATTPIDPRVLEAMMPYLTEVFGNASSKSHEYGWRAEEAVEKARNQVARLIGARPQEILFTSGATESNNLALIGVVEAYAGRGKHIVTSAIEHKSILDTCAFLERRGVAVDYLPVDKEGIVDLDALEKALRPDTVVVSIQSANNEIGTLQPLKEIGKTVRGKGALFHVDAAQSAGKTPLDMEDLGIDLLSLSAHKIYGPKGVGALYVRRKNPRVEIVPQMHGGGQERELRAGTLNVPGIVGMGKAAGLCQQLMTEESARLSKLRDEMFEEISSALPAVFLNGHPTQRLPGNLNLSFACIEAEALLLGMRELAISTGSACASASLEPSHVLKAIGVSDEMAHSSIRLSLGRFNTQEEVSYASKKTIQTARQLREKSPVWKMALEAASEPLHSSGQNML